MLIEDQPTEGAPRWSKTTQAPQPRSTLVVRPAKVAGGHPSSPEGSHADRRSAKVAERHPLLDAEPVAFRVEHFDPHFASNAAGSAFEACAKVLESPSL